ncbi:hypothetical protein GT347_17525 [Xylophilus rhododendri]|uniref:Uncharacterized protein n=1 Tax=Xylophilus rhododendri TaxID=2697032 RepID=A0A857J702_9BURK|nr:hypothetical protein [Xylophilus rhododendri]QHI99616.1 hypothetical protein GT347_17525 [Xylophilus rhododendri]
MSIHSFAPKPAARKHVQRQQQPARFWLNRQQQQQGYSEYQHGQVAPARASAPEFFETPTGAQNEKSGPTL